MLVNHISRIHKYQEPRKQKPKHIRQNLTESQVVRAFQRITRWILILQNESWNKKITQVYAISFDRIYSNSKTVSMKRLNFLVIKKIALAENGTFNCHNQESVLHYILYELFVTIWIVMPRRYKEKKRKKSKRLMIASDIHRRYFNASLCLFPVSIGLTW